MAGREIERLAISGYTRAYVSARLARVAGAAGAEHLEFESGVGLTDEGSLAQAEAVTVAARVAGGTLRRLGLLCRIGRALARLPVQTWARRCSGGGRGPQAP